MEIRSGEEDDTISRLYEASMEGSVFILNSLTQKDPLILSKISLTTFTETPMHISALLGHHHFTKQLLALDPKLAFELDSLRRLPLHLASAKGHAEIVRALLQQNQDPEADICFFRDECRRIPLHYAAMRGHVDVIELLVAAQHRSIFEVLPDGETVLHLCVQYNHLEALKVLVKAARYDNTKFLNSKEHSGGNTILHLAVMLKQIETIKYLLSIPGVKAGAKNINNRGFKASDMVEQFPRDLKTLQVQRILMEGDAGIKILKEQQHSDHLTINTSESTIKSCVNTNESELAKWWRKWIQHVAGMKGHLSQETHNSLMVVATVIAAMTFQTAVNPPGGVWQDNSVDTTNPKFRCSKNHICIAGTAIFADSDDWRDDYKVFIRYNSISFLASLGVILLLISGLPMGNKFGTWILTVVLCISLTFMALTFLQGLFLVTPDDIIKPVISIDNVSFYAWSVLLGLIALFHSVRFLCWVLIVKRLRAKMVADLVVTVSHGLLALAKGFKRKLAMVLV